MEFADLDSIMEDAKAISLPELYLGHHYRSRHESLFAFSNALIYEDRIHSYPCRRMTPLVKSPCGKSTVCTGTEAAHTDRAEAEALVAEIVRRLEAQPNTTLGVITFNSEQQQLAEELFTEATEDKPDLAGAAANPELLSVRWNPLQGEERDVILLSTVYGPPTRAVTCPSTLAPSTR